MFHVSFESVDRILKLKVFSDDRRLPKFRIEFVRSVAERIFLIHENVGTTRPLLACLVRWHFHRMNHESIRVGVTRVVGDVLFGALLDGTKVVHGANGLLLRSSSVHEITV